jgi:hypothetical protein
MQRLYACVRMCGCVYVRVSLTYQYYATIALVQTVRRLCFFRAEAQLFSDLGRGILDILNSVLFVLLLRHGRAGSCGLDLVCVLACIRIGEGLLIQGYSSALGLGLANRVIVAGRSLAAATASTASGGARAVGEAVVQRRKHGGGGDAAMPRCRRRFEDQTSDLARSLGEGRK